MAEPFDPYLKWLGIPPKHQPANDYRLLGIELFESDSDVISHAADQRMAHLKNFAAGKQSAVSQKILNEIAAARVRLLNPERKQQYDTQLRSELQQRRPAVLPKPQAAARPVVRPAPAMKNNAQPAIVVDTARPSPSGQPLAGSGTSKRGQPPWVMLGVLGAGICVVVVLIILLATTGPDSADPTQADRSGDQPGGEAAAKTEAPQSPVDPQLPEPNPPEDNPEPDDPKPPDSDPVDPPEDDPEPPVNPDPVDPEPTPPEPVDPTPPVPEPPNDPQPPKPAVTDTRLAVPDDEAQQRTGTKIREIFAKELSGAKTPAEKLALAGRLRQGGLETKDDAVARFVLLRMAVALTAEAEELEKGFEIVDELDQWYLIDALEMKADVLETVSESVVRQPGVVGPVQQIIFKAQQLAEEALSQAAVKTANRLVKIAMPAARKLRDRQLIVSLQATSDELDRLETRHALVENALASLERMPDNDRANSTVGSWTCFIVGDWEKGLPYLAKGEDADLAEFAALDLSDPKETARQVALGDGWWKVGETKKGLEQSRVRSRAVHWYRQALAKLTGLERARLMQRLAEAGAYATEYALKFDGMRSHVLVYNFGFPGQTPITLETFVRPSQGAVPGAAGAFGPGFEQAIIGNMGTDGLSLGIYGGRWNLRFSYSYQSPTSSYVYTRTERVTSTTPVVPDKWTHLAGVYDGSQIRLYVDGQLEGFHVVTGVHKPSAAPFVIGAAPLAAAGPGMAPVNNFFKGDVKTVRISNLPRYTKNFTVPEKLAGGDGSTVLLFSMNEGQGVRLNDGASKNIFGEIREAEWIDLEAEKQPAGSGPPATGGQPVPAPNPPPTDTNPGFAPHLPARPPLPKKTRR